MYANFIHFVLALFIFNMYRPPDHPFFNLYTTAAIFLGLKALLVISTTILFRALNRKAVNQGPLGLHSLFNKIMLQQAILALIIFAVDIYVLNIKIYVEKVLPFSNWSTWMGFVFLVFFAAYMVSIWSASYASYQKIFETSVSKQAYLAGNIRFSFPVVIAWLLISGLWDIAGRLPFENTKRFLYSLEGQVILSAGFLMAVAVVAPALIKTLWQCRPLPPGPTRERIEAMCRKAQVSYNNILDWPLFEGKFLSAGVMGLVSRFRYILVTKGLLDVLDNDELDAVMAHEIGHVKKHHLGLFLFFFLGFAVVISLPVDALIRFAHLYGSLALPARWSDFLLTPTAAAALWASATITTFLIYFRYVFGYFMRNLERQADLYPFRLMGTGRGIASSLEKIANFCGKIHDRPSWHHFSIQERIDYINKCESDRKWIARHDRKLHISIAIFAISVCAAGYLGYSLQAGSLGANLSRRYIEKKLASEIAAHPNMPQLHHMLGDYYVGAKAYQRAIRAYERAISLDPHSAEVFNNLAWIYATCEDLAYRNPSKALTYARNAAALKTAPHILDTLAESYYINGQFADAIKAIDKALSMNPDDLDYYKAQRNKFEKTIDKAMK